MGDGGATALLKVKLVEQRTVKHLRVCPKDPVATVRLALAEMTADDQNQFTLFKPATDDDLGQWLRDDYPLDFYIFSATADDRNTYFEWRRTTRALKVILAADRIKSYLIDDTLRVGDLIPRIVATFGMQIAVPEEQLLEQNEQETDLLYSDMTLREQSYGGECLVGLYIKANTEGTTPSDLGLFVRIPFKEGWLLRKRAGVMGTKSWTKQWFVLQKNKLYFYNKSDKSVDGRSVEPQGCILAKAISRVKRIDFASDVPSPKGPQGRSCFEVITGNKDHRFVAKSPQDSEQWITQLDLARRMFAVDAHSTYAPQRSVATDVNRLRATTSFNGGYGFTRPPNAPFPSSSPSPSSPSSPLPPGFKSHSQSGSTEKLTEQQGIDGSQPSGADKDLQETNQAPTPPSPAEEQSERKERKEKREKKHRKTAEGEDSSLATSAPKPKKKKSKSASLDPTTGLPVKHKSSKKSSRSGSESEAKKKKKKDRDKSKPRSADETKSKRRSGREKASGGDEEASPAASTEASLPSSSPSSSSPLNAPPSISQILHTLASTSKGNIVVEQEERMEDDGAVNSLRPSPSSNSPTSASPRDESEQILPSGLGLSSVPKGGPVGSTVKPAGDEDEEDEEESRRQREERESQANQDSLAKITLAQFPELAFVLGPTCAHSGSPTSSQLLIAWANYHLSRAGYSSNGNAPNSSAVVTNLKSDWRDLEPWIHLLHHLEPEVFDSPSVSSTRDEVGKAVADIVATKINKTFGFRLTGEELARKLRAEDETFVSQLLATICISLPNLGDIYTSFISRISAVSRYLNSVLKKCASEGRSAVSSYISSLLPLKETSLLSACKDGILLCKLVGVSFPETIDDRAIHVPGSPSAALNPNQRRQNWNLCFNALQSTGEMPGPVLHNLLLVSPWLLCDRPEAPLDVVWTVVETCILRDVSPKRNPSVEAFLPSHLLLAAVQSKSSLYLSPAAKREVLQHWFNHHLKRARPDKTPIANFTIDLEDSENYLLVLGQLLGEKGQSVVEQLLLGNNEEGWERRAQEVVRLAELLGAHPILSPRDILEAENEALSTAFLAELWRVAPSASSSSAAATLNKRKASMSVFKLSMTNLHQAKSNTAEETPKVAPAESSLSEVTEQQELVTWLRSLKLEKEIKEVVVDDYRDGTLFLSIISATLLQDNKDNELAIDPKMKTMQPGNNVFKKFELCNYVLDLLSKICKKRAAGAFPRLIGKNIADGNRSDIFAVLNLIRRLATQPTAGSTPTVATPSTTGALMGDNKFKRKAVKNIGDSDLLAWVRKKVTEAKLVAPPSWIAEELCSAPPPKSEDISFASLTWDPRLLHLLVSGCCYPPPTTGTTGTTGKGSLLQTVLPLPPVQSILSEKVLASTKPVSMEEPSDGLVLLNLAWRSGIPVDLTPTSLFDSSASASLRTFVASLFVHDSMRFLK